MDNIKENLLEKANFAGIKTSGGDYENYLMAYDDEVTEQEFTEFCEKNKLSFFYGWESEGFNGGTFVAYKDEEKLPLYIKEAIQNEREMQK